MKKSSYAEKVKRGLAPFRYGELRPIPPRERVDPISASVREAQRAARARELAQWGA